MEFDVKAGVLGQAVRAAAGAVAARTTKPALRGLKLTAAADTLTVQATDLEIGMRLGINVGVSADGSAVVSAEKLVAVLAEADAGEDVRARLKGDVLRLAIGGARYELPTTPADEFPDLPAVSADGVTLPAAGFARLVRLSEFAVDKRSGHKDFSLRGVLVEIGPKAIKMMGTDSKVLALAERDAEGGPEKWMAGQVPAKALKLAVGAVPDGAAVRVSLTGRAASFSWDGGSVVTQLYEGRPVPYRAVIDQQKVPHVFRADAGALARAVRRAKPMTDAASLRVSFKFSPGRAVLSAKSAGSGESRVELDLPGYAGPELAVECDPDYWLDVLRAADSGEVEVSCGDKDAPFFVRTPGFTAMIATMDEGH